MTSHIVSFQTASLVSDLGAVHGDGGWAVKCHSRQASGAGDWRAGPGQAIVCGASVARNHEYLQKAIRSTAVTG